MHQSSEEREEAHSPSPPLDPYGVYHLRYQEKKGFPQTLLSHGQDVLTRHVTRYSSVLRHHPNETTTNKKCANLHLSERNLPLNVAGRALSCCNLHCRSLFANLHSGGVAFWIARIYGPLL